jgi:phospholipid/cholesterol/gamma-HCH transport system permease protein
LARIGPALARPGLIVRQIYNAGARSLVIIILSGMFVGMVLGLLGFDVFQRFGSEDYVGVLAALGNLKVLGPVLTALLFAGRAGTSLTSEIGLMKSANSSPPLQMMAVDPVRYVVVPRFLRGLHRHAAVDGNLHHDRAVRRSSSSACSRWGWTPAPWSPDAERGAPA